MIRRPPRSTLSSSSAASDVYKRQHTHMHIHIHTHTYTYIHTHIHTHTYTHIHTHTHTYTHIHTYTHARTYTHTYTHTRIFARGAEAPARCSPGLLTFGVKARCVIDPIKRLSARDFHPAPLQKRPMRKKMRRMPSKASGFEGAFAPPPEKRGASPAVAEDALAIKNFK